jgi:hypothetical protein
VLTSCRRFLPDRMVLSERVVQGMTESFDIPSTTWQPQYRKATGYYHTSSTRPVNGETESHSTSLRFLIKTPDRHANLSIGGPPQITYSWTEIGIWTQHRDAHSSILLCLISDPCNAGLVEDIRNSLVGHNASMAISHPYAWHAFLLPHISRAFHTAVWKCRDLIREVEISRPSVSERQTDYPTLHELSRHILHSTETLSMALNVTEDLLNDLIAFRRELQSASSQLAEAIETVKCERSLLQCEHGRSQSLESRLRNEIDLV